MNDIPTYLLLGENIISLVGELSEKEIRHCTIRKGNTHPRVDGFSVVLLSACWELIGKYITHLFRACVYFGHHHFAFKLTEVEFLPKPERDLSSLKGWRPISLLSCLRRGLESIFSIEYLT